MNGPPVNATPVLYRLVAKKTLPYRDGKVQTAWRGQCGHVEAGPEMTKPRQMRGLRYDKDTADGLARVAVHFDQTDALLELHEVCRRREIRFAAATLCGFEPVAQLFKKVCKHDGVLQGSDVSPVDLHQGLPS